MSLKEGRGQVGWSVGYYRGYYRLLLIYHPSGAGITDEWVRRQVETNLAVRACMAVNRVEVLVVPAGENMDSPFSFVTMGTLELRALPDEE